MFDLNDMIEDNRKRKLKYSETFFNIFGISLFRFMHPLFGFDIISFDKWLNTPDGTSTSIFIREKFGVEAQILISDLISDDYQMHLC